MEIEIRATLDRIVQSEAAGVPAIWLAGGGGGRDALTLFAAAALRTQQIKLGTSIVQTWPRHPFAVAQQSAVIDALAPGRLRVGVGPGHQAAMESLVGARWRTPLRHLREYVLILKSLFEKGSVDFEGEHWTARAQINRPIDVPVMISALREGSFKLSGVVAEGAITWLAPFSYLQATALPAIKAGAAKTGRTPPPLIVHAPICLSGDREAVREATRDQLGRYGQSPTYKAMFAQAGYKMDGELPDELIDNLVVFGSETRVVDGLKSMIAGGAGELIVHPLVIGEREAAVRAAFEAVAAANA
jgi:F420-dependent oxidoreductase-like protein